MELAKGRRAPVTVAPLAAMAEKDDSVVLDALRAGDEEAFRELVARHQRALFAVALSYAGTPAAAEEVVQETWLGVLRGIDRFEGRSSLKTWIFAVLVNQARSRGRVEQRSIPFPSFPDRPDGSEGSEPAIDPRRFRGPGDAFEGYWVTPPKPFGQLPEERVTSAETLDAVAESIRRLPPLQQQVIALRDIEGWSAEEVCSFLELSEANQRVLLHRARSRVRSALEEHFAYERAS